MGRRVKYAIGWPEDKTSSANEITGPGPDGERRHILAIRWGCSCCRNDADSIEDLEPEERQRASAVVEFLNKWDAKRKKPSKKGE